MPPPNSPPPPPPPAGIPTPTRPDPTSRDPPRIHRHTHTQIHMRAHTHTLTGASACARVYGCMRTYIHTHAHRRTPTNERACARTHTRVQVRACACVRPRVRARVYARARLRTIARGAGSEGFEKLLAAYNKPQHSAGECGPTPHGCQRPVALLSYDAQHTTYACRPTVRLAPSKLQCWPVGRSLEPALSRGGLSAAQYHTVRWRPRTVTRPRPLVCSESAQAQAGLPSAVVTHEGGRYQRATVRRARSRRLRQHGCAHSGTQPDPKPSGTRVRARVRRVSECVCVCARAWVCGRGTAGSFTGGLVQPCVVRASKHGCYVECEPPSDAAKVHHAARLVPHLRRSVCRPTAPSNRCRLPQRYDRRFAGCIHASKWAMESITRSPPSSSLHTQEQTPHLA